MGYAELRGEREAVRELFRESERVSRIAAAAMVGLRGSEAKVAANRAIRAYRDKRWSEITGVINRRRVHQDDLLLREISKRTRVLLQDVESSKVT